MSGNLVGVSRDAVLDVLCLHGPLTIVQILSLLGVDGKPADSQVRTFLLRLERQGRIWRSRRRFDLDRASGKRVPVFGLTAAAVGGWPRRAAGPPVAIASGPDDLTAILRSQIALARAGDADALGFFAAEVGMPPPLRCGDGPARRPAELPPLIDQTDARVRDRARLPDDDRRGVGIASAARIDAMAERAAAGVPIFGDDAA